MEYASDFGTWYRRSYGRVRGALLAISGDVDASRDAADEAFTRALEHWPRVSAMNSPEGWAISVGMNRLRRQSRRKAVEGRLLRRLRQDRSDGDAVRQSEDDSANRSDIWRYVARLPERQRIAVALRYIADLPEEEVAARMHVSRGTVASTLSEARRRLSQTLEPSPRRQ